MDTFTKSSGNCVSDGGAPRSPRRLLEQLGDRIIAKQYSWRGRWPQPQKASPQGKFVLFERSSFRRRPEFRLVNPIRLPTPRLNARLETR